MSCEEPGCPPGPLERVLPPKSGSDELLRCRACGAFYRTRHTYEFLIPGTYEEDTFWRLSEDARKVITQIAAHPAHRDELLSTALRDPSPEIADCAALIFWGAACAGESLPQSLVAAAEAHPASSPHGLNQSYRGLLEILRRGPAEAAAVGAALDRARALGREHGYAQTLRAALARK